MSVEACSWYDPLAFAKPLCLAKRLKPSESRWGQSLSMEAQSQDWHSEPRPLNLPVSFGMRAEADDLGLCVEGISWWHLLLISRSHFSPRPLHTYLFPGGPSPSFNIQSLPPMPSFLWTLGSLFPHPSFHQPLVPAPSGLEQTALLPSRQGSKDPAEGDGAHPEETPGDGDKASRWGWVVGAQGWLGGWRGKAHKKLELSLVL